jgi:hypothetical protein
VRAPHTSARREDEKKENAGAGVSPVPTASSIKTVGNSCTPAEAALREFPDPLL